MLILTLQSCIVSNHPNSAFFDNPYYDFKDTKFMSVNVPMFLAKPFIKKALKEDGENPELIALIKKVKDVKVLTIENGNQKMLADFTNYLNTNQMQEWLTVKKDNEIIKFSAKQSGETITKLLITISSAKEMVYVDVDGNFTPADISNIINYSEKSDVRSLVKR